MSHTKMSLCLQQPLRLWAPLRPGTCLICCTVLEPRHPLHCPGRQSANLNAPVSNTNSRPLLRESVLECCNKPRKRGEVLADASNFASQHVTCSSCCVRPMGCQNDTMIAHSLLDDLCTTHQQHQALRLHYTSIKTVGYSLQRLGCTVGTGNTAVGCDQGLKHKHMLLC